MHLKHWLLLFAAVALFVEELVLASLPGQLSCGDAVVQKIGLQRLQSVLRWRSRPVVGDYVVRALIQRSILAALVALLQPGTDAGEGPVLQSRVCNKSQWMLVYRGLHALLYLHICIRNMFFVKSWYQFLTHTSVLIAVSFICTCPSCI